MNTITIKTPDGLLQTSLDTISKNPILSSLVDANNTIETNINICNMRYIVNYLRGYTIKNNKKECDKARKGRSPDIPLLASYDASLLGIEFEDHVKINVGGKLYYLPKDLLASKLGYFKAFFNFNKNLGNDFSSILIDRCSLVFDNIIEFIRYDDPNSYLRDSIKEDLAFYNYEENNAFIDLKSFIFCQKSYQETLVMVDAVPNDSNIFYSDDTSNKYFICQFKNPLKQKSLRKFITINAQPSTKKHHNTPLSKKPHVISSVPIIMDIELLIVQDVCSYSNNILLIDLKNFEKISIFIDKFCPLICSRFLREESIRYANEKNYYRLEYGSKDNKVHEVSLKINTMIKATNDITIFKNLLFYASNTKISHFVLKQKDKIILRSKSQSNYSRNEAYKIELLDRTCTFLNFYLTNTMDCELIIYFTKMSYGNIYIEYENSVKSQITLLRKSSRRSSLTDDSSSSNDDE